MKVNDAHWNSSEVVRRCRSFVHVGSFSQDEIIYCSDVPADSCGCLEDEDPCDSSVETGADSDPDEDSDDEPSGNGKAECADDRPPCRLDYQRSASAPAQCNADTRLDDDEPAEDGQKELQSLL